MMKRAEMKRTDFKIGAEFWCGGRQWRCVERGIAVSGRDAGTAHRDLKAV
jgi:hypothetical protein